MYRKPIGIGANAMSINPHFDCQGAPYEEREVRLPGVRLLLHDVLDAVGDGLEQSGGSDTIWPEAVLDEAADAPLRPDDEHHADHVDREGQQHLDQRGQEPHAAAVGLGPVNESVTRRRGLEQSEHDHTVASAREALAIARPLRPSAS
jgi:hypothetical protein